ncbi:MAG: cation transporter [Lachnospiraceae bacterium]|nr:cation transporter [Lachnospiraceae bacterium]
MSNRENTSQIVSQELYDKLVKQMTEVGVLGNVFLAVFKIFAGIFGHSTAMVSDAIHTFSDVFATIIAWYGVKMANRGEDKEHPYGHERLECVAAMILGVILLGTGAGVGFSCYESIVNHTVVKSPGVIALVAAIVSIAVKEGMFWYTMHCAKIVHSTAFKADAWHHRGDALSSVGALIGIAGARMGYPVMDKIAGIIICLVIIGVGAGTIKDAIGKMLDSSADDEYENEIKDCVNSAIAELEGINSIQKLFTRKFGEKFYTDIYVRIDPDMPVKDAYNKTQVIASKVRGEVPQIKFAYVHMVPDIH